MQTPTLHARDTALTPDSLLDILCISAPRGPISVKGLARELNYWTKPGEDVPCRLYGRLALGDASIRFELPGLTVLQDEAAVVLHGTLRIKPIRQGRASHEVILVGDVVSEWKPLDALISS